MYIEYENVSLDTSIDSTNTCIIQKVRTTVRIVLFLLLEHGIGK
jgi:hypothetical protein